MCITVILYSNTTERLKKNTSRIAATRFAKNKSLANLDPAEHRDDIWITTPGEIARYYAALPPDKQVHAE